MSCRLLASLLLACTSACVYDVPIPVVVDGGGGSRDAGPGPIPGSGKDGDTGTAVLVMLRIDQGTANVAAPLQGLVKDITAALTQQGLSVTSVAVSEMYAQEAIWALRDEPKDPVPDTLASALREVSATRTGTLPTSCSTDALLNEGAALWTWTYAGSVRPFMPGPGALMVILIDSGARPRPLSDCRADDFSNADPIRWARLDRTLRIRQTQFLMLATPENSDLTAMRQRCAGIAGFPLAALDVLAPSPIAFFDPWASQMNARKPELAKRIDLCDALGTGARALWQDIAKGWFEVLETLR
ncbi:MAG TPA: hypothetical protein VE755_07375 [Myxococcales bacterium]|nr:hypothetical protein [Myxococcales bacterium]